MWYNFLDHIFDHNEHFSIIQYPGVAQLVGRLVWELEHQNGSTSQNVAYFPVYPLISANTAVESSKKLWYNLLDHIFDHIEQFLKIQYPGVAQLVGRLVWDQDAASSSLATRTKTASFQYENWRFYLLRLVPNWYFRLMNSEHSIVFLINQFFNTTLGNIKFCHR